MNPFQHKFLCATTLNIDFFLFLPFNFHSERNNTCCDIAKRRPLGRTWKSTWTSCFFQVLERHIPFFCPTPYAQGHGPLFPVSLARRQASYAGKSIVSFWVRSVQNVSLPAFLAVQVRNQCWPHPDMTPGVMCGCLTFCDLMLFAYSRPHQTSILRLRVCQTIIVDAEASYE